MATVCGAMTGRLVNLAGVQGIGDEVHMPVCAHLAQHGALLGRSGRYCIGVFQLDRVPLCGKSASRGHVQVHAVKRQRQTVAEQTFEGQQWQHIQVDNMLVNHVYPAFSQPGQ